MCALWRSLQRVTEVERRLFIDLIADEKPEKFRSSDLPLLVEYCRTIALADEAWRDLRAGKDRRSALATLAFAHKSLAAFSHRLRLSPQGRSPTNPKREPVLSYYERMDLEEAQDDAH
jgi:hypothetical protein